MTSWQRDPDSDSEPTYRLTKRGEYVLIVMMFLLIVIALGVAGGIQYG